MELKGNGIIISRSQRAGQTPWWWISNEGQPPKAQAPTYIHRETIKAAGGRWSRKRKQWYLIAQELPESIRALVDAPHTPSTTPSPEPETDFRWVAGGKVLTRTTVRELEQQGLVEVKEVLDGQVKRIELSGVLFQGKTFGSYREIRLLTAEDKAQQALAAAQAQVATYLGWLAIVEKWRERANIPALPEPDEDQPRVQVLAPIDDPWS